MTYVGVPFGPPFYVIDFLEKKEQLHIKECLNLTLLGATHPKHAYSLLRLCGSGVIPYFYLQQYQQTNIHKVLWPAMMLAQQQFF